MPFYRKVVKGNFLARPNRFIAQIRIGGETHTVHVKNTGRCRELLLPDATVYLAEADQASRKTRFDLIAVEKQRPGAPPLLINMDSQLPNDAVAEWLPHSGLISPDCSIRREVKYGNSRFDFMLEENSRSICVEVKGVTLERDGLALFPDAPTERGVKHLHELTQAVSEGLEAWVIFVIQMKGIRRFSPNDAMHPEFGDALRCASRNGVRVLAMDCIVTPDSVTLDSPVPVAL